MPVSYSVAAAAAAVGLSKTTVFRAIQAGFLSATKNEINEWQVDPAELAEFCRRYAPVTGHSDVIDSARPNALLIDPHDLARRAEAIRSKARFNEIIQAKRLSRLAMSDQKAQQAARSDWWRQLRAFENIDSPHRMV
jgi:hypothetical protein